MVILVAAELIAAIAMIMIIITVIIMTVKCVILDTTLCSRRLKLSPAHTLS